MKTMTIPAGPDELTRRMADGCAPLDRRYHAVLGHIELKSQDDRRGVRLHRSARAGEARVRPPEPGAPASLIAKFPGASEGGREIGNMFDFYHREIRFYEEIADEGRAARRRGATTARWTATRRSTSC